VAVDRIEDRPADGSGSPYDLWYCYDPLYGEIVEIGEHYAKPGRHLDYAVHWGIRFERV
jgi:hypothetical protein